MRKLLLLTASLISCLIANSQSAELRVNNGFKFPTIKISDLSSPAQSPGTDAIVLCEDCNERRFVFDAPAPQIFASANSISFNQPISITTTPPKTIKSIRAELVYFEMVPDDDLCFPCNKDDRMYGHFPDGTNSIKWNGPQSVLAINISTPLTPCCGTTFRWCIRYLVEFSDCVVCSKLVCYEMRKEGCNGPDGVITGNGNRTIKSN